MPATLCLLRHGRASAPSRDADLVPEGERHVRALARKLAGEGYSPAVVLTSPYRRAHHTALLVVAETAPALEPRLAQALRPESDMKSALAAIARQAPGVGCMLVVGHMPLLGQIAMHLTGEDPGFAPGTLVEIELDPGAGRGRLVRRIGPEDVPH